MVSPSPSSNRVVGPSSTPNHAELLECHAKSPAHSSEDPQLFAGHCSDACRCNNGANYAPLRFNVLARPHSERSRKSNSVNENRTGMRQRLRLKFNPKIVTPHKDTLGRHSGQRSKTIAKSAAHNQRRIRRERYCSGVLTCSNSQAHSE